MIYANPRSPLGDFEPYTSHIIRALRPTNGAANEEDNA